MTGLIVVFPNAQDAKNIRNLLVRNGYEVAAVCTSGAQALGAADRLGAGVIVCGYKFPDMIYSELFENLPESFQMLLLASSRVIGEGVASGVMGITMPLRPNELFSTLDMVIHTLERRRKKRRSAPVQRNDQDKKEIREAKELLMARNHMSEEEAHRYLQKASMDSSRSMVESARMVLALMDSR